MIEDELSKLPEGALADYRHDERLQRVWGRLEADLGRQRVRPRPAFLYLPAFAAAVFALGVLVGRTTLVAEPAPSVLAEPPPAAEATPRALPATAEQRANPQQPATTARARQTVSPRNALAARPATEGPEPAAVTEPVPFASASPAGPPEWQTLAESGDFAGAHVALERSGGFQVALVGASPEVLMSLADLARATGSRDQAVTALRRLLTVHPDAPETPLAAWTLGNLLEQTGDRSGAAEAFALYRRLSPTGDFAEDAAARQFESALSEGNLELARQLVDQYAKDFPHGRRVAELREELAKVEAEVAGAGAPSVAPESGLPEPEQPAAPTAP
jgi:TolA-binding protein